jgi:hypothetical protein
LAFAGLPPLCPLPFLPHLWQSSSLLSSSRPLALSGSAHEMQAYNRRSISASAMIVPLRSRSRAYPFHLPYVNKAAWRLELRTRPRQKLKFHDG